MIRMRIKIDNAHLEVLQYALRKVAMQPDALPATAKAVEMGAKVARKMWQDFALGGKLRGVKPLDNPSGHYARSIKIDKIGPFEHEVYSESKIAERIEKGTDRLDMKQSHTRGPRSRRSESTGHPYVIIPFRWGTPESGNGKRVGFGKNIITAGAYKRLLDEGFKASRVKTSPNKSKYKTPNAAGDAVGRAQYKWGSRLDGVEDSRMEGMVRFENGYDREGKVRKRYGGYFTFRVISADPNSESFRRGAWVRPATPSRNVAKTIEQEANEVVNAMVGRAILRDIRL